MDATLVAVIAIALFFDFTNGFHDAANAIATSVSTRALTPRLAVAYGGALNFVGALISIKVATTVGSGIVHLITGLRSRRDQRISSHPYAAQTTAP